MTFVSFSRGKGSLSPGFLQYARKFFSFVKFFLSFLLLYSFQRTVSRLVCRVGGDEEDRTPDPLLAKQVLSQLSYTPIFGFPSVFQASHCGTVFFSTLKIEQCFLSTLRSPLLTEASELSFVLLRKEVIQPHLPIRLPCYDFTPVIGPAFGSSFFAGH